MVWLYGSSQGLSHPHNLNSPAVKIAAHPAPKCAGSKGEPLIFVCDCELILLHIYMFKSTTVPVKENYICKSSLSFHYFILLCMICLFRSILIKVYSAFPLMLVEDRTHQLWLLTPNKSGLLVTHEMRLFFCSSL